MRMRSGKIFVLTLSDVKRFIAIILLLLYSTANFGLSLRLYFCGESLYGFGLYSQETPISPCCEKMGIPEDCCSSEQVFLQNDDDKTAQQSVQNVWMSVLATPAGTFPTEPQVSTTKYFSFAPHSLKNLYSPPKQVLFCCFLI